MNCVHRNRAIVLFLTASLMGQGFMMSQEMPPKREMRAVWLTTINGIDWPRSTDPAEQQRSLLEIVERLHAAHFNTIFFQVRGRGDAFYGSHYEPWAEVLTGTLGRDPGWDPLAFIIREAHERGMELHAWFNTYIIRGPGLEVPESTPRHPALKHPEWVRLVGGELWIDPGIPAARHYLMDVALDIVGNYNVDGIQFDFARYPLKPFPDNASYKEYGRKLDKEEWRRENITAFMRMCYDSISVLKPAVSIGSSPIGIYINEANMRGMQSYYDVYQDSYAWLKEGIQDYLVPQVYWSLGDQRRDPDFAKVVHSWSEHTYGRHVYIGIGAYKQDVGNELPEEIDTVRSQGLEGVSFFRYGSIEDALEMGNRFRYLSNVPPSPWKIVSPVHAPARLIVDTLSGGVVKVSWQAVSTQEQQQTKWYGIYRSDREPPDVTNPANLLAVLPAERMEFVDSITVQNTAPWYYAVTAVDSAGIESVPVLPSPVIPEPPIAVKRSEFHNKLGSNYLDPYSSFIYVPYEIEESSSVIVKILDQTDREILTVVDGIKQPGRYISAASISRLKKGYYTCLFTSGKYSEKKLLRIAN